MSSIGSSSRGFINHLASLRRRVSKMAVALFTAEDAAMTKALELQFVDVESIWRSSISSSPRIRPARRWVNSFGLVTPSAQTTSRPSPKAWTAAPPRRRPPLERRLRALRVERER